MWQWLLLLLVVMSLTVMVMLMLMLTLQSIGHVLHELIRCRVFLQQSRQLMRQMGLEAGVEIVPDGQLALAEATEQVPGVLFAGLPGAGGVDAIYCLTFADAARSRVEELWAHWREQDDDGHVCPLLSTCSSLSSVKSHGRPGLRLEH